MLSDQGKRSMYDAGVLDLLDEDEVEVYNQLKKKKVSDNFFFFFFYANESWNDIV